MTINLADILEQQVQTFADAQGRDVQAIVEEAVREYLVWASITDVSSDDLAQAQLAMLPELAAAPNWHADSEETAR